jgi:hypothetical protein
MVFQFKRNADNSGVGDDTYVYRFAFRNFSRPAANALMTTSATIQARREFQALGGFRSLIIILLTRPLQGSARREKHSRVSLTTSYHFSEAAGPADQGIAQGRRSSCRPLSTRGVC